MFIALKPNPTPGVNIFFFLNNKLTCTTQVKDYLVTSKFTVPLLQMKKKEIETKTEVKWSSFQFQVQYPFLYFYRGFHILLQLTCMNITMHHCYIIREHGLYVWCIEYLLCCVFEPANFESKGSSDL